MYIELIEESTTKSTHYRLPVIPLQAYSIAQGRVRVEKRPKRVAEHSQIPQEHEDSDLADGWQINRGFFSNIFLEILIRRYVDADASVFQPFRFDLVIW